jgi:hypothetical protein
MYKNYGAFTDKVERICYIPAPGWNCVTHRHLIQVLRDTSEVSPHESNKVINYSGTSRELGIGSRVQLHQ